MRVVSLVLDTFGSSENVIEIWMGAARAKRGAVSRANVLRYIVSCR